jgi:hypothetical protein
MERDGSRVELAGAASMDEVGRECVDDEGEDMLLKERVELIE